MMVEGEDRARAGEREAKAGNSSAARARIFSPGADTWLRFVLLGLGLILLGAALVGFGAVRSDWATDKGSAPEQPVPFSHKHHVGGLGIDCRYCHSTVETAASAGYPPTATCMSCHSQIWAGAEALAPVRRSFAEGTAIRWRRVYDLPDFVYFNHAVHVNSGVGCDDCHADVAEQHRIRQAVPLTMGWCLECHRAPEDNLRPPSEVFNADWSPPADRRRQGRRLLARYHVGDELDHCYLCHR